MYNIKKIIRRLFELDDTNLTGITDAQGIKWDSGTSKYIPVDLTHVWGEITGTLSDQTDLQSELDDKIESVDWGDIGGTLSDQTDLQSELDGKAPLAGVTGDFSIGETATIDTIQLDLTPTETQNPGCISWDATHETAQLTMPRGEVVLQIGQENHLPPTKAGEDLVNGDVVYISGATGTNITVMKAKADDILTSWVAGIATEDGDQNEFLKITIFGAVHGINTSGIPEGYPVWLSPTVAGGYTITKPTAPNISVFVGFCIRENANNGVIVVRPDLVSRSIALSDVYIDNLLNGDIYKYDYANTRFQNHPHNEIIGPATVTGKATIGDLSGGNTTHIKPNGTIVLNGDATTFDDMASSLIGKKLTSNPGTADYNFDENSITFSQSGSITDNDDVVGANVQYPHKAILGAGAFIDPHIHWWQPDATAYIFTLQHRVQDNNALKTTAWVTTTATAGTDDLYTYPGSGDFNNILQFPNIDMSSHGISSTIQFRLTRTDSLGGTVDVTFFDFHYEQDTMGSAARYIKSISTTTSTTSTTTTTV